MFNVVILAIITPSKIKSNGAVFKGTGKNLQDKFTGRSHVIIHPPIIDEIDIVIIGTTVLIDSFKFRCGLWAFILHSTSKENRTE